MRKALGAIFCVMLAICLSSGSIEEYRLYNDLLKNYNHLERPVANSSLPLEVKIRVVLQQIIDVDEKNQVIQLNTWLKYVSGSCDSCNESSCCYSGL